MSEVLPPIGFWSYTSSDDEATNGRLSALRVQLAKDLQLKVGRQLRVKIFQDVAAIPHGTDWLKEIRKALAESSFLIPIITPAFLQSEMCCREVMHFREREIELGRDDLIFPLHYVNVDSFASRPGACHDPEVFTLLKSRQWIDFRSLRIRNVESEAVLEKLDDFSESLAEALSRVVSPQGSATTPTTPPPRPVPPTTVAAPPIIRQPQPGDTDQEGPDFPKMILIRAGSYQRGVPPEESEREGTAEFDKRSRPVRTVTIPRPFWLGVTPVTRGQFAAFVNATGYDAGNKVWTYESDAKGEWSADFREGRNWRNPGFRQDDSHPVVCINHDDAMAYVDWLNTVTKGAYRLPSEAEWEYAARAGTTTARYWGETMDQAHLYANAADQSLKRYLGEAATGRVFMDGDDGFPFTSPVAHFRPNSFGLHDMLGNVWEWCADRWHDDYNGAPDDGSAWTPPETEVRRVLRGGSWGNYPRDVRAGFRLDGDYRYINIGCRLARTFF